MGDNSDEDLLFELLGMVTNIENIAGGYVSAGQRARIGGIKAALRSRIIERNKAMGFRMARHA